MQNFILNKLNIKGWNLKKINKKNKKTLINLGKPIKSRNPNIK